MLDQIKADTLTDYVGTSFDVLDDPSKIFPIKLTNIVELVNTERHQSFSLIFRGPLDNFLAQQIHKLKHPNMQELEIFLVPVSRDKDGFEYEAVFNHIL